MDKEEIANELADQLGYAKTARSLETILGWMQRNFEPCTTCGLMPNDLRSAFCSNGVHFRGKSC